MLHEGQEEVLLVREVVVDGRAPHTRVIGDVGQGDLVEAALAHELGQCPEQGGARGALDARPARNPEIFGMR